MIKLTIDGIPLQVQEGTNLLQACEMAGAEIPRFCYHERLSIAGNCRMCLVEDERSPKPLASCAMPAADGMIISTKSDRVKAAREGVMEFLLVNHPLDCPICDQGGECDLQDQAMGYGHDRSRYQEHKRAVSEKYMGPLIKTVMTRCIHCTRCVRFATEIAGTPNLGAIGRGEDVEITTYLEQTIASELSANVIDLCPVGALTSRPYAFIARPWELTKTETIDVMDAQGSHIRADARGNQIMRILPRQHDDINEEWISDKARYAIDGLRTQRLDQPYIRDKEGRLNPADWPDALTLIHKKIKASKPDRLAAIAGDLIDAESMFALKTLFTKLGSPHLDCRQEGAKLSASKRVSYLFNSTIAGIAEADAILLIGTNPRFEAPVLNARIRQNYLRKKTPIALVGAQTDLTYPVRFLGDDAAILTDIAKGRHKFAKILQKAKRPLLILGMGALTRPDSPAILGLCHQIAESTGMVIEGWNGFNVLHHAAGRVAGLDLGFVPQTAGKKTGKDVKGILTAAQKKQMDLVWLLGADEIDMDKLKNSFVIYQGHHGDKGAIAADVILPGAAWPEKNGLYVNFEGRVQHAPRAIFPPGAAKEDWAIIRALAERLRVNLGFDSHAALREQLITAHPHFGRIGEIHPARWVKFGTQSALSSQPIKSGLDEFYMTCAISRASATMAQCYQDKYVREKMDKSPRTDIIPQAAE